MERYIKKYCATVDLLWSIMIDVNITQADRVGRIRKNVFELDLGSDQDFFESINWYAVKAINVCSKYSMMCDRRNCIRQVVFWNCCIVYLSELIGAPLLPDYKPFDYDVHRLWCEYPKFFKALKSKSSDNEC